MDPCINMLGAILELGSALIIIDGKYISVYETQSKAVIKLNRFVWKKKRIHIIYRKVDRICFIHSYTNKYNILSMTWM